MLSFLYHFAITHHVLDLFPLAATGRTVVLPPAQNFHFEVSTQPRWSMNNLLNYLIEHNLHLKYGDSTVDGLDHFYSFESEEFKKRVNVISMAEFIELEAKPNGLVKSDTDDYKRLLKLSLSCENLRRSE